MPRFLPHSECPFVRKRPQELTYPAVCVGRSHRSFLTVFRLFQAKVRDEDTHIGIVPIGALWWVLREVLIPPLIFFITHKGRMCSTCQAHCILRMQQLHSGKAADAHRIGTAHVIFHPLPVFLKVLKSEVLILPPKRCCGFHISPG